MLETDIDKYVRTPFTPESFDIAFVDGTQRVDCFMRAMDLVQPKGFIVAHDSLFLKVENFSKDWKVICRHHDYRFHERETAIYANFKMFPDGEKVLDFLENKKDYYLKKYDFLW